MKGGLRKLARNNSTETCLLRSQVIIRPSDYLIENHLKNLMTRTVANYDAAAEYDYLLRSF